MVRGSVLASLVLLVVGMAVAGKVSAQEKPEISKADWALTDDAANPGASAIILYRETDTDDKMAFTKNFYRIKILKEDGKKYGDVSISFEKGRVRIGNVEARTLHPDGHVADFDGTVYEKEVVKTRGVRFLAKTFTLPDVQVGSIIEYSYTSQWNRIEDWILTSPDAAYIFSKLSPELTARWIIQDELFTKRAHFSFRPIPNFGLSWTWANLPGKTPPAIQNGVVEYDAIDVPGFQAEDYIPPEYLLKSRVEFFYVFKGAPKDARDTKWYWQDMGDKRAKAVEQFIGKDKSFSKEVASVVENSDSADAKLRKIYARVQQLRNLSFESQKTEEEEKREKLTENRTASEVLKHGFGWGNEINEVFVGMARAAGFDAAMAYVAQRNERFFNPSLLDWSQLSADLVVVHLDGKDRFFDPATRFCPYGLVPWQEATTQGYRLDKDGASEIKVPPSPSSDTIISRKADLTITDDGGAKGKFELSFTGQDALERRLASREKDNTGRRKDWEDEVKRWFPSGATVMLGETSGWSNGDQPLKAEFSVETEGSMPVGVNRLLYPAIPFPGEVKYLLQSARRTLPVYITYPYEEVDDFTLHLPKTMRVESVPGEKSQVTQFGRYLLTVENQGAAVHIQRHFMLQQGLIPPQYYGELRGFLSAVRQADATQMVFQSVSSVRAGSVQ
ncbi:MAG TPA: DUF3857 domain-containing protein [Terriglobia bacterium]|nr:DUF3857 domain-containing protein [Terriglobia bacterium]